MSINILYADGQGTEIRSSSVNQHDAQVSFAPISIKTVLRGAELYHFDKKLIRAQYNRVIVGNQNSKARVLIDSDYQVQGMCIDFGLKFIDAFLQDFQFDSQMKRMILEEQLLTGELKSQSRLLQKDILYLNNLLQEAIKEELIEECLLAILDTYFQIQQFRLTYADKLKFKKKETRIFNADIILDTKSYLDRHLTNDIHLDQLSQQIGLSKFQLLRMFKDAFDLTPHQYVIQKRLEMSLKLLPQMPINEVALQVGFSDSSAFGKAFKQQFGMTPSDFPLK